MNRTFIFSLYIHCIIIIIIIIIIISKYSPMLVEAITCSVVFFLFFFSLSWYPHITGSDFFNPSALCLALGAKKLDLAEVWDDAHWSLQGGLFLFIY